MFVNALMLPQFDYLDIIYGRAGKTKLFELDLLYRKVAKIALKKYPNGSGKVPVIISQFHYAPCSSNFLLKFILIFGKTY